VRELARDMDASEISAGLVGVALGNGESEIFTVRAVGSLGEETPTKRIIEAVIKKSRRNQEDVVDFVTWKEL
jgi:precorrin-2 methylase